jgi:uncharacterized RDD family membrane protein YckC
MKTKYCKNCGGKALATFRMCPSCGSKDFDSTQPSPITVAQQTTQSISTSVGSAGINVAANINYNSSNSTKLVGTTALTPAPLGARTMAYVIDTLILAVLSTVPVAISYLLTLPYRNSEFSLAVSLGIIFAYLIPFFYHTVLPASKNAATYGKKIMGLKILTLQGEILSRSQAFIRILLIMLLPLVGVIAISLSLGGMAIGYKDSLAASIGVAWILTVPIVLIGPYLTVFFNPQKQTLYDIIVKTIVIKG